MNIWSDWYCKWKGRSLVTTHPTESWQKEIQVTFDTKEMTDFYDQFGDWEICEDSVLEESTDEFV